jgi:phosphate starvation-inducible PhoH-like protein
MSKKKQKLALVEGSSAEAHKQYSGKKSFSQHNLVSFPNPTFPQEQFIESHYKDVPVIAQVGSAGTGKTAVALYCALDDVFNKETPYEKVAIFRSAVQARDIGFLPGDQSEKDNAFEAPYVSLCDELIEFKTNNYENLKNTGYVEFHNTSFLRGTTFNDTILIVDECQSMTYHELSTIMTRVGIRSKIIFCGDMKQNDLHKKGDKSGLEKFMRVLEKMDSSSYDVVTYTPRDIVRSGIVKEFLIAEGELGE